MSKTVEEAKAALDAARAAVLSEMESDITRKEGSGAQERRREERQQKLRDVEYQAARELEQAERRQRESASGNTSS
ncbi:hypothetical protein [Massilia sp. CT11-137]|uniref:hypothetical protein n=1 Tax=Massilia sp. CT11-137 TaxID=3393901 RepID=UPI0039B0DF16